MADIDFFKASGPFHLSELAKISVAEIAGSADPLMEIKDVAPLDRAGAGDISFLDNPAYQDSFATSAASACIVSPKFVDQAPDGMALLVCEDPYRGYALIAQAFYPADLATGVGISPLAHVDSTAQIGSETEIEPGAVIGARAKIGKNCRIGANAFVGAGVKLGDGSVIGPLASVRFCIAGDRLRVAGGVRIGEDGFGYASGPDGHVKIPQLGRVVIGSDVEIGANTCIDRGSGPDTVIGDGCIIDNLVQIAHNVRIGNNCVIVAQAGIAGSTTLGNYVVLGGQVAIIGHLNIGDGVRIGGQAGVISDVPAGSVLMGTPAMPQREYWRQMATLKQLAAKKTGKV
jgi:UDP-3-O-[3-hydroxymyristoyl] glucosamine N-acyltransferase